MRRAQGWTVSQEGSRAVGMCHTGVGGMLGIVVTFLGVPLSLGTETLSYALVQSPFLLLDGHGVVQVEHEERRRGCLLPGREGPRTVRQSQD